MKESEPQNTYFTVNGRKSKMNDRLVVKGFGDEILRNGIGISSSPATETPHQWRELWKYGAGYIVIKTASHERTHTSPLQTRINTYTEGDLTTLENIGKTFMEQEPIDELVGEIKAAREEGIFLKITR